MEDIILLGCGGHCKSVVDTIERQHIYNIKGFVDKTKQRYSYRGYNIIGDDGDLQKIYDDGIKNAFICVGYLGKNDIRNKLYIKLKEIGYKVPIIVDPSSIIANDAKIEEGTFIGKNVIINSDCRIGKNVILNTSSIIEHDCIINDYCHISCGAIVCGGSIIGKNCFIGAGAKIIHCLKIGDNSILGAGYVAYKNIEENSKKINYMIER